MRSLTEKAIAYDGQLSQAAMEVIAQLDEDDGVIRGTPEYGQLVRVVSRAFGVRLKDLLARVSDYVDD